MVVVNPRQLPTALDAGDSRSTNSLGIERTDSPKGLIVGADLTEKMTVQQVCQELGISRSTFYFWRQHGKAPHCVKLPNGQVRIRRTDLEAWFAGFEEIA